MFPNAPDNINNMPHFSINEFDLINQKNRKVEIIKPTKIIIHEDKKLENNPKDIP